MNVVIIGGTGHVGTYLVPRLVMAGHQVINVSRGKHSPYQNHSAWKQVKHIKVDREKEEADGKFGGTILSLKPDVVIDMICFTLESAKHLVKSLKGHIQLFLHCGTIWVHGHCVEVPTTEDQPRCPCDDYGFQKEQIEKYLLHEARTKGFPASILHPGHIVGPGWTPLNPMANLDLDVFRKLAKNEEVTLPNFGMETVHHVHADDVAQGFIKAILHRNRAIGESFHIVSPQALTLRGYAEKMASWFGHKGNLRYQPFDKWKETVTEEHAEITFEQIPICTNCSIEKAKRLLDYQPRYSSFEAITEAVSWLVKQGEIKLLESNEN
jgi:nucleoside-diphosphate-sugar epimerase